MRGDPTLHVLAEIGVLVLLFDVGLEADLRALVRVGPSAMLVAVIGVVTPFTLGWATARWLGPEASSLAHLFVGATLTATSVGITARVLKDLGTLQSREGQVILGAAVLDDVHGLHSQITGRLPLQTRPSILGFVGEECHRESHQHHG